MIGCHHADSDELRELTVIDEGKIHMHLTKSGLEQVRSRHKHFCMTMKVVGREEKKKKIGFPSQTDEQI
jgi:hypothetical protein